MTAPKPNRHALIFIFITVFLDMVGFSLIMPVIPRLIQSIDPMDIADAAIIGGWMFFAFGAMQFLFGPLLGNLSDTYGRRPILLLAIFGLGLDYVLTAFATQIWLLFLARLMSGVCGASYTTANAYLADITKPEDRAAAFGKMGAAFGLGFIIGPAIGGVLGDYDPRLPFFAAAALSLLNFTYGYFILPETLAPENRRPFELARSNPIGVLRIFSAYKQVLPLSGIMFIYFFASSVYPAIWPFWGTAKFGWNPSIIGVTLAVFGLLTAIVQGVLTGPVVKRLGERKAAIIALVAATVSAAGYGFAGSTLAVILLIAIHTPEGFFQPSVAALMSNEAPADAQGELQGGIASLQNLAMLVGTLFFAQVFGYFMHEDASLRSPDVGYFVAAGLCLLSLVLLARHRYKA
jgi:MFS transporter, DHA1 family, tetracycline resistance protein